MTAVDAVPTDTAFSHPLSPRRRTRTTRRRTRPSWATCWEGKLDRATPYSTARAITSHPSTAPSRRRRRGSGGTRRSSRGAGIRAWTASPPSRPTSRTCWYRNRSRGGHPGDPHVRRPPCGSSAGRPGALLRPPLPALPGRTLSGGQVIGRLAARHYDLPAESLRTWRFEGIEAQAVQGPVPSSASTLRRSQRRSGTPSSTRRGRASSWRRSCSTHSRDPRGRRGGCAETARPGTDRPMVRTFPVTSL